MICLQDASTLACGLLTNNHFRPPTHLSVSCQHSISQPIKLSNLLLSLPICRTVSSFLTHAATVDGCRLLPSWHPRPKGDLQGLHKNIHTPPSPDWPTLTTTQIAKLHLCILIAQPPNHQTSPSKIHKSTPRTFSDSPYRPPACFFLPLLTQNHSFSLPVVHRASSSAQASTMDVSRDCSSPSQTADEDDDTGR
jgi:hypothetical protein